MCSGILNYSLDYELLHYHYDRWLFKTVTGAINTAVKSRCSPAKSLETKTFSQGYWQTQHRMLIDAVRQFGYPTLFLTISPFEWTFPQPPWLDEVRQVTGRGPTELSMLETLHISHCLEQLLRGYVTGKNTNRWKQSLFASTANPNDKNLKHFFYRFEFQKRGTVHIHALLRIHDLAAIDVTKVSASIPFHRAEEAFLVADLQTSSKTVLPINSGATRVVRNGDQQYLQFQYGYVEKEKNIRAYVTTLLGSLHCRVNLQSSDGKGMLLKYVSSYVYKCHDAGTSQQLYSPDLGAFQAASSFRKTMQPLEPEMVLQMTCKKVA